MTSLDEVRDLIAPGVWCFSPEWECRVEKEDIVVIAFGKSYVVATHSEIQADDYKRFIAPRLTVIKEENWA